MKILYLVMAVATTLSSAATNPLILGVIRQSLRNDLLSHDQHYQTLSALNQALLVYVCKKQAAAAVQGTDYSASALCQYLNEVEGEERRVKKGSFFYGGGGDNTALAAVDVLKGKVISLNNNRQRQQSKPPTRENNDEDSLAGFYSILQRMDEQGK